MTGSENPPDPERPEELGTLAERRSRPAAELTEAERRRRRAQVFGDVLPEGTSDERGDGWSERDAGREGSDEWLRGQVPPHHG